LPSYQVLPVPGSRDSWYPAANGRTVVDMALITTSIRSAAPATKLTPATALDPDTTTRRRPAALPAPGRTWGSTGNGHETLRLLTVLLGAFLSIADFFIVNVALPTIDRDLHASAGMLELVVAGYAVAYAVLLVTGGRLGDSFGRKRLFLIGLSLFTVLSLVCGLAPTAGVLVAARMAQGAAAALMVPQVLGTIQATATGESRTRAIAWYGATGGIGMVVGQAVGGALVDANIAGTGWRPIFLVNVPIGLVGLLLARRVVPETRSETPSRPDLLGALLVAATVLALVLPLSEGRALRWPLWSVLLLAAAPVLAGLLLFTERRLERRGGVPTLPPSLLAIPSMRRGLVLVLPFFTAFGGFMFVYAVAVQQGAGLSPLMAGLAMVPLAVGFLLTSLSTPRLLARYGRRIMTVGAGITGIGMICTGLTTWLAWPHLGVAVLAVPVTVIGIGQGLVMSPLFGVVLSDVPVTRAGTASGTLGTTQQTALALGVALLGSLFLSLSGRPSVGMRDAFLAVIGLQILAAIIVSALTCLLPDPRPRGLAQSRRRARLG
jgi:MFS family permease